MGINKVRYFCYEHEHQLWRETVDPNFPDSGGIQSIPFIFIVQFYHECHDVRWEKAWCREHQTYEAIAAYRPDGVVTEAGCELQGWQVPVRHNIYQTYHNHRESYVYNFCWGIRPIKDGFMVTCYGVEVAFPFSRFFLEDKNPRAPHVVRDHICMTWVDKPEGVSYMPASLLKLMFPDYAPPPRGKVWDYSDAWQIQEFRQEREFYHVAKPERKAWECSINGYDFRQIRDERAFHNIRKHYNPDAAPAEELQEKIYFCLERNGRTLCTMVIDDNVITHRDIICRVDRILRAKLLILIRKWQEICHLRYYDGFAWEDSGLLQGRSFVVSPLQDDPWEDKCLGAMLVMAEEDIKPGYYLQVYRKMYATDLLFLGPKPAAGVDDLACLRKQWPYARRIFDAAAADNPEAQYVMHLIYADGNFNLFNEPDYNRSQQWYKKSVENGWLEQRPNKNDVTL